MPTLARALTTIQRSGSLTTQFRPGRKIMGFTNQNVLDKIQEIHESRPFGDHPAWAGMIDGAFDLKQTREFARQFGIIPLHNHNYHGRLYVHCPDPTWRAKIAEVVYEEGTGRIYAGGVSHNQLYYDFGEALGIDRDDLLNSHYCSAAIAFKSYFIRMCEGPFLDAVSCHMLAAEAQGPGVFAKLAKNLQKNFKLGNKGVAFWTVHDVADEDHSGIGRELLEKFATSDGDRKRVLDIVQETVDIMFMLYDGMYHSIKAAH
ncbi:MAG: iron-containing redox enzyme family protein [Alphaproteobacteria bacterium]|nr:iron-containing redox enzyme family protein [Alphaproteobacteria bacterium]